MAESKLVSPHGSNELKPLLLEGKELKAELEKAKGLPKVYMTSRETSDVIMLGIGAFTPLDGFMNKADWQGVCDKMASSGRSPSRFPLTRPPPTRSRMAARSLSGTRKTMSSSPP